MKRDDRKLEKLVAQTSEAMASHDTALWDPKIIREHLEDLLFYLDNAVTENIPTNKRKLTAFYNFTPKHCPNCGTKITWSGSTLIEVDKNKEEYETGSKTRCQVCNLTHHRLEMAFDQNH